MKISKMDEFKLKIKRVRDFNPLHRVNVNIDLIFADKSIMEPDGKTVIDEEELSKALYKAYHGKLINLLEQSALAM